MAPDEQEISLKEGLIGFFAIIAVLSILSFLVDIPRIPL